jgi:hypothetical protein
MSVPQTDVAPPAEQTVARGASLAEAPGFRAQAAASASASAAVRSDL